MEKGVLYTHHPCFMICSRVVVEVVVVLMVVHF
jgi:hypothetical protein